MYGRQPRLQGERSHAVGRNVKRFQRGGVGAGSDVSTDAAGFGLGSKQATLILNVPDLKWGNSGTSVEIGA